MRTAFLAALELCKEIPAIKWAEEDLGQLEGYETKPAVPTGTVLISVNILRVTEISDTRQICHADVVLRYYANVVKQETSSKAPEAAVARSLSYYDDIEAIHKKFQGFYSDELDTFKRQSCVKERRNDGLTVVRMPYATTWIEDTADDD